MMFYSWKITEVDETHSYDTPSDNLSGYSKHYTVPQKKAWINDMQTIMFPAVATAV
jgi:hypothetical protein